MKYATSNVSIIKDNDQVVGVGLGADFTSEHEWGIKKMRDRFQCPANKKGLYAHQVGGGNIFTGESKGMFFITSYEPVFTKEAYLKEAEHWPAFQSEGVTCRAAWDESHFLFLCSDKNVIDTIADLFQKKDMGLFLGEHGPFCNGGLSLLKFTSISEELHQAVLDKEASYEAAKKRLESSKGYKLLHKNKEKWIKEHKGCNGTPWDYFALSPRADSDNIWLNPHHQSHLTWGWITLDDIEDWANGKVGKVILSQEKWDDVVWLCSHPILSMYVFDPKHEDAKKFSRIHPDLRFHVKSEDVLKALTKAKKGIIPDLVWDSLTAMVKHNALDDLFGQIGVYNYGECRKEYLKNAYERYLISENRKERLQIRAHGIDMTTVNMVLRTLGFGEYGCSNVSSVEGATKNLSYWRSNLEDECYYDFMDLCDQIPTNRKLPAWKELPAVEKEKE